MTLTATKLQQGRFLSGQRLWTERQQTAERLHRQSAIACLAFCKTATVQNASRWNGVLIVLEFIHHLRPYCVSASVLRLRRVCH